VRELVTEGYLLPASRSSAWAASRGSCQADDLCSPTGSDRADPAAHDRTRGRTVRQDALPWAAV